MLVDDEERQTRGGHDVLAHQEGQAAPGDHVGHDRVGFLAVQLDQLEGEQSVDESQHEQGHDHGEHRRMESIDEVRARRVPLPVEGVRAARRGTGHRWARSAACAGRVPGGLRSSTRRAWRSVPTAVTRAGDRCPDRQSGGAGRAAPRLPGPLPCPAVQSKLRHFHRPGTAFAILDALRQHRDRRRGDGSCAASPGSSVVILPRPW